MTAKEWRENNPDKEGNIRDYTDILHLVILSNLEVLNASMIENNISQKERLEKLNMIAKRQITILTNDSNVMGITKLDNQNLIGGNNNVLERQLISQFLSTYTPQEQAESHKKK